MWQFNFAGFFDIFCITKCDKVISLQSVADCYYKVRQVLQSVTVVTKWDVTTQLDNRYIIAVNVIKDTIKAYFY